MDLNRHILQVYVGSLSSQYEALSIEVSKQTSCFEIVACIVERLSLNDPHSYELAEVIGNVHGQECKERRLGPHETPVGLQLLWPQSCITDNPDDFQQCEYRFCLREKISSDSIWAEPSQIDSQLIRDYFYKFLYQPKDKEYPDLCQLTNLTEQTLLENLKVRFAKGHIYTYVGSILISVNPFKYYPIYNPKYVKLYQNHRLEERPPHIFAIADAAYQSMLKQQRNQCIVISGESGSGKTEATLFLLHHLTMLSHKGSHGSGVEQTILSSGPVLEAFGNAKTAHNNNSSRFGKFIQVTYKENGLVQGACVQKYLLEKSRICSQAYNERSYHVFYYLLAGGSNQEVQLLYLMKPSDYRYLSQSECYTIEGCDEQYEFIRLKQSMEMVGFTQDKQHRLFAVLSAVLLLGNIEFSPKKSNYHHDESVMVRNWDLACKIATLLGVSEDTLVNALTSKKAKVHGETLVINYRLPEALATRDALAKCLYGALFDWIVLQVNYSLISLKEQSNDLGGNSIGVLDIFGFEDFLNNNRFEQFCINYANEHLQHYFNQHVFEYEQEEYKREGINWTSIAFQDNVDCLALIERKPCSLLCILDDQCSFPGATNETFLQKINSVHKDNEYYEIPQKREAAFIIKHYAGKVKYQIEDIREKNLDLMRPELISVLKNSQFSVVRELAGADPVAVFRWAILRAFFRGVSAFQAGRNKSKRRGSFERKRVKHKISVDNSRILAAIENTQNRLRKTRHNRCRSRIQGLRNQKNLKSVKALAQRTQTLTSQGRSRKTSYTVTGQFQLSLQALMEALNEANPFFIRCIKSNASKEPNMFDNELVQRQLRYTGMLETVRIRQAGFNVRMTYEEFTQMYRILLPHGLSSTKSNVLEFLLVMNLDKCEYQMGRTKIFMRESQKQKLDLHLHQTILSKIIVIQRWYRSRAERRYFLTLRAAIIRIQAQVRCWLARQMLNQLRMQHEAAAFIQRIWRGYRVRRWYSSVRQSILRLQARIRGNQVRERFQMMLEEWKNNKASRRPLQEEESISIGSSINTITTELPSTGAAEICSLESQQLPFYTRRVSGTSQKGSHLERIIRDPKNQTEILRRRASEESPSYDHQDEPSRRLSETTLMQSKKRNEALAHIQSRSREDLLSSSSSPPSGGRLEKMDVDGNREPSKGKSYRHRDYRKVPGIESVTDQQEVLPEGAAATVVKFPKFKRHLKGFMTKREGSLSESEDNSCQSSGPHTPVSVGDLVGDASSLSFGSPLKATRTTSVDLGALRRESKSKASNASEGYISKRYESKKELSRSLDRDSSPLPKGTMGKEYHPGSLHDLKPAQMKKGEMCSLCDKPFSKFFVNHGFRCSACLRCFHPGCIQGLSSMTCSFTCKAAANVFFDKEDSSPLLKKSRQIDDKNWNVTRTSQFIDSSDEVIKDISQLKALEDFITQKIYIMKGNAEDKIDHSVSSQENDDGEGFLARDRKDSQVDTLFLHSLQAFKRFLVSFYSIASQNENPNVPITLKYKDLIKNFEQEMNTVCQQSPADSFPVIMGINAFRGFLDEFIKDKSKWQKEKKEVSKKRRRTRKKKDKKAEEIIFGNHLFIHILVNIYTQCEVCNSFLWLSTKALSCQMCKVTCHQKCLNKVEPSCNQCSTKAVVVSLDRSRKMTSGNLTQAIVSDIHHTSQVVFGVPLVNLVVPNEKIPSIIERLMVSIELHGLYTEGLYRKSGASSKVKDVKNKISEDPSKVTFEDIPIHVLTTVLKSYLRELPEPLITYEAYGSLLHASALENKEDMFHFALGIIQKLPKAHFHLLERLIFHLTLVAQCEEYNRMSCNGLAIVFTPCILRSPPSVPVHESLSDISEQTKVVELLIWRQLAKTNEVMRDIESVDNAWMTAETRLNHIRLSKTRISQSAPKTDTRAGTVLSSRLDPREALAAYKLEEQLENLHETKCRLTLGLTELVTGSSEEDLLSTDISRAGSLEDVVIPSTRSVPCTPSLGYEDGQNWAGVPRRPPRERRRFRPSDNDEEDDGDGADSEMSPKLNQEYNEDAVMV